jgi:hypothetical protein
MSLYLPRNLVGLAGLAGRDSGLHALAAVRVRDPGNGLYRVEATDGRVLAIVQGPVPDAAYPLVEAADEGPPELLVQLDAWVRAFKLGDKRRPVGIGAGGHTLTLAVGDQSLTSARMEGRYPAVDTVLPRHGPLAAVRLSPALLAELLKVAIALEPEPGVTLLYYGKGQPLGLLAHNAQGQTFDALLMPLT